MSFSKTIIFPKNLRLKDNYDEIIKIVNSIYSIKNISIGIIYLNFKSVVEIDIQTIFFIGSNIHLINLFFGEAKIIISDIKYLPKNKNAKKFILSMGNFNHNNLLKAKMIMGNKIDAKAISNIIEVIYSKETRTYKKCYEALYEAISNAIEHAYNSKNKKWCICAYSTKNKKTFAMYDFGIGLHKSIMSKEDNCKDFEKFKKEVHTNNKSFIEKLMNGKLKYNDGRGNGMVSFTNFINEFNYNGILTIYTNNIKYCVTTRKYEELKTEMVGTLIIWSIKD